jgi:hypothetical protein
MEGSEVRVQVSGRMGDRGGDFGCRIWEAVGRAEVEEAIADFETSRVPFCSLVDSEYHLTVKRFPSLAPFNLRMR